MTVSQAFNELMALYVAGILLGFLLGFLWGVLGGRGR